jgi:hypothetical protein
MRKALIAVAAMLAAAGLSAGAEISLPEKVVVKPGRLFKIAAKSAGKVRWVNVHDDLDLIPDSSGAYAIGLGARPGAYKVAAYAGDKDGASEPAYCTVVVEGEAPPPPGPKPDPKPDPKPGPKPDPVVRPLAFLVVVEETGAAGGSRGLLLRDRALQEHLKAKKTVSRVVDKDVRDGEGNVPKDVRPYLERAKGKALPQLYLVAADGSVLYEGACPGTAAAMLSLLKKIGG